MTFVPQISEATRTNPIFKYEHTARPGNVKTAYAVPIFDNPNEWSKTGPAERRKPIAALLLNSVEDIRPLLQRPQIEDRLATYAQICGEYLRDLPVAGFGEPTEYDGALSELHQLKGSGFYVSARKSRSLFKDQETRDLVERIEELVGKDRQRRIAAKAAP